MDSSGVEVSNNVLELNGDTRELALGDISISKSNVETLKSANQTTGVYSMS